MSHPLLFAVLAAVVAGFTTNLLVPLAIRVARALRAVDRPGGRRHLDQEVPRLGGLALVAGLALGVLTVAALQWTDWASTIPRGQVMALLIGGSLVFALGVVDDLFDVSAAKKLGIQILAASVLVLAGWSFDVLRLFGLGDVRLGLAQHVVSVLFIVGVINAINLIDGLDGLASGVVTIISLSLLVNAIVMRDPATMILMGATAGACLGFLPHNWSPARIFMGDSGALTLGFVLAGASVQSYTKTQAMVAILVPILALGVPMFDTVLVMVVRFLRQSHGPVGDRFLQMFRADRSHLHHVLEHLGASRRRIVWTIYAAVLACCAAAMVVALRRDLRLGFIIVALEFVVILVVRQRGMAAEARRLAAEKLSRVGIRENRTPSEGTDEEPASGPLGAPRSAGEERPASLARPAS
ncbi:MAG TPA: MraY family glycosyltransferase [Thermoanaerobaculia bacterium]|nr:MraY family glycosyltransferase [Thermoanaerobaculia bacterium]